MRNSARFAALGTATMLATGGLFAAIPAATASAPAACKASTVIDATGLGAKSTAYKRTNTTVKYTHVVARRHATAASGVTVKATSKTQYTVTATVDVCPDGHSNPKTVVDSATKTASKTKTGHASATVTKPRGALKKAAKTKASNAAVAKVKAFVKTASVEAAKQAAEATANRMAITDATTASGKYQVTTTPPPSSTVTTYPAPTVAQIAAYVLVDTNAAREAAGVGDVTSLQPVLDFENTWAQHLIDTYLVDDESLPDDPHSGVTPADIPALSQCTSASRIGEIIDGFYGLDDTVPTDEQAQEVAQEAVSDWVNEPAHDAILVDSLATRTGAGVAIGQDAEGNTLVVFSEGLFRGSCPQIPN